LGSFKTFPIATAKPQEKVKVQGNGTQRKKKKVQQRGSDGKRSEKLTKP